MALEISFRGQPAKLATLPNIADGMSEDDRNKVGQYCRAGYMEDRTSRSAWEMRYAQVLKLALQVMEIKTYPWPNASNVKFPLVTISALSFHSKAYPALVPAQGAVHCAPVGVDPSDAEIDRCARIGGHMSYQLQECTNWEAETDKALIVLPILGCAFKKTYYDPTTKQRRSDLVLPQNFIVHYFTSDLDTCPRASEWIELTKNEVFEYEAQGLWLKGSENPPPPTGGPLQAAKERAQGVVPPVPQSQPSLVMVFIEQQAMLDLDGDGYDEPYTVTFEESTGKVRRIVSRYLPRDISYTKEGDPKSAIRRIQAEQCYTKIPFIPSPDGGFYDLGFGSLIGPLNHSVDTLINQLIDGGTMSTLGGGFLGRGVRIKKGGSTFVPQEWKTVDSTGDDLAKNIYALPTKEPSKVLLELLMFLVDYAARISSANEVQLGEALGQNAKAEVVQILNENGARTFSAIFKRIHRATKEEFRKFYELNRRFPIEGEYKKEGKWFKVSSQDYAGVDYGVMPSADPNIVTDSQKRAQAQLVMNTAAAVPGHNIDEVVRQFYKAFGVTNIDRIFPGAGQPGATPPSPDAKMIAAQVKMGDLQLKQQQFQQSVMEARAKLFMELQQTQATIVNLYAQAAEHMSNSNSEDRYARVAEMNAIVAAKKAHQDGIVKILDILAEHLLPQQGDSNAGTSTPALPASDTGNSTGAGAGTSLPFMAGSPGNSPLPGVPTA